MSDKRGKWTKKDLKMIWNSYIEDTDNIYRCMKDIGKDIDLETYNLLQKAPCPLCGEEIVRAQYQGDYPDLWGSWDVDHIDGNPNDNNINNLQPTHPICNKKKG